MVTSPSCPVPPSARVQAEQAAAAQGVHWGEGGEGGAGGGLLPPSGVSRSRSSSAFYAASRGGAAPKPGTAPGSSRMAGPLGMGGLGGGALDSGGGEADADVARRDLGLSRRVSFSGIQNAAGGSHVPGDPLSPAASGASRGTNPWSSSGHGHGGAEAYFDPDAPFRGMSMSGSGPGGLPGRAPQSHFASRANSESVGPYTGGGGGLARGSRNPSMAGNSSFAGGQGVAPVGASNRSGRGSVLMDEGGLEKEVRIGEVHGEY
jgi:hypothetical protein